MNRNTTQRTLSITSGLIILLLLGSCTLRAQKQLKQDIFDAYQKVNLRIERCQEEGSPCGLYLNQIQTNPGEEPWAVVGIYQSTRDLWYQRDPSSEEERFHLVKVNTSTRRSARTEKEEYLYTPEGQLQFYYFGLESGGDLLQEFRFYFSAGKLIDYLEEIALEEVKYKEWSEADAGKVQQKGNEFQALLQVTL